VPAYGPARKSGCARGRRHGRWRRRFRL
jgi:hypothetical protein